MGRRNRPFYRLVVTDSRHPRDGRFIDSMGHYDPLPDPAAVEIDEEKVMKWLGEGAEMSDTVRSLLSREGILKKWHESKSGEVKKEEKVEKTEAKAEKDTVKKPAVKKPAAKKKAEKDPKKE
jgi:small subunit ribosomal protein S16